MIRCRPADRWHPINDTNNGHDQSLRRVLVTRAIVLRYSDSYSGLRASVVNILYKPEVCFI
ncbi:hypothetical protein K491DRAFT_697692 [Lophiostoma macrostomum CBS 122681]|uniref:Uncharacterized protein n=1 Tax=Lophiostoma macrostomum CBS 122681 TaxID=1314788 RepID=A0A6A6SQ02_9PLEO|nr:hypothetical protein K491DRAFT_697692 [Lophiostoma macrostomum CBS 122681]